MASFSRFEEIEAWQVARRLTGGIYEASRAGAFARDFGLCDQVRRSSVSVMANIAEGFESRTPALFYDYLGRAKASCAEVRSHLYVAWDAQYLDEAGFRSLYEEAALCGRMIHGLMAHLRTKLGSNRVMEPQSDYNVSYLEYDEQP